MLWQTLPPFHLTQDHVADFGGDRPVMIYQPGHLLLLNEQAHL